MKTRISVHDLRKGMWVTELDRPWLGTPFLFQGFEITTDEQLEQLRGLQYEVEKLRNQVQSSEAECGKLRQEVASYRGESERHVKEREDIAASLTRSMNEALARLRGETV